MEGTPTFAKLLAAGAEAPAGIAREEFEQIVRAHQRRIYRVLLGLVRQADVADTLTQECFLRAYQKRRSFRGDSSVGTWLVRIAVNLAIDHARSPKNAFWRRIFGAAPSAEQAAPPAADELADPRASPERELAAREHLREVWATVEELSPQQRAAFVLRYSEEMTLAEVADAMGLEIGTVKAHLFRGVEALRKRLKEKGIHAR